MPPKNSKKTNDPAQLSIKRFFAKSAEQENTTPRPVDSLQPAQKIKRTRIDDVDIGEDIEYLGVKRAKMTPDFIVSNAASFALTAPDPLASKLQNTSSLQVHQLPGLRHRASPVSITGSANFDRSSGRGKVRRREARYEADVRGVGPLCGSEIGGSEAGRPLSPRKSREWTSLSSCRAEQQRAANIIGEFGVIREVSRYIWPCFDADEQNLKVNNIFRNGSDFSVCG
jgi:hypothetical protein